MNKAWVGVDVGKEFHWAHLLWMLSEQSCSLGRSKMTKQTSPGS
jgi:hypothetical protein